ncbi:MAG: hypothetical protein AAF530_11505 [Pseudomonadota bacterium]
MGESMNIRELEENVARNERLAGLAEEQGNLELAKELAAIAQEFNNELSARQG